MLLVSYRPEYQHGWGSKTSYTQLRLDPLPLTGAEDFLQALLGDDAGRLRLEQGNLRGYPTLRVVYPSDKIHVENFALGSYLPLAR